MQNLQKLKINEIFCSRQGEGLHTGELTIFIRLSGCNLNCEWCDTKYAKNGADKTINNILAKIKKFPTYNISITGGEPLVQKQGLINLIKRLIDLNYIVSIETNGSIDWKGISKKTIVSMDIKTPSSKMQINNNYDLIKKLTKKDQLKFVISNKKDYSFIENILNKYKPEINTNVILQPAWGLDPKKLWNWSQKDNRFRLMLQMHKIVWDEQKGV